MPRLTIPERYRDAVARIANLDDITTQRLIEILEKASSAKLDKLLSGAADSARRDLRPIADALIALYVVRVSMEVAAESFASDVADAMVSYSPNRGEQLDVNQLRTKLERLLGVESFAILAKAKDLATEDERTFCEARVISDLRPIFGASVNDSPVGMALRHILRIGFHDADGHENVYVSLSSTDLQTLKRVLERAEAKAKSIQTHMEKTGIRYFGGE